jgi:hypothetical protein
VVAKRDATNIRPVAPGSRSVATAAGIAVAAALLCLPAPGRATTYKWTDDKGVVHYSDSLPPDAVNRGTVQLNKQGVPIAKTDPALTPEQRKARAAEEERQKQLAKEQEDQARRDRALLSSYTTEGEIDLTKNRALATIDNVVQSMIAYGEQLNRRKSELLARKRSYGDKPVPAVLDRELESIDGELVRQQDVLAQKKREAEAVTAKYDGDRQRWHELVLSNSPLLPGAASAGSEPPTAAKK